MIPLFKVLMAEAAPDMVKATLLSGQIAEGPRVLELEEELRRAIGTEQELLTVSSCTAALDLALHMAGVGPGDEVVTTAQTCTATNTVIVNRKAVPVWADVDPATGLIDPDSVRHAVTSRTKAIMAVDWGGLPCNYDALRLIGPPVIEDAAHAFLSLRHGKSLVETGGDYVCWSFQAIKHLTTGDGGLLRVPPGREKEARLLRWYGLDRRTKASFRCEQDITEAGYKYHMNDVAASIGLANLPEAIAAVSIHRMHAKIYNRRLAGLPKIQLPPDDHESAWWLYTLLVEDRKSFIDYLAAHRIEASPVHARNDRHSAFARVSKSPVPLPGLDHFAEHEVAIPVGWWLKPAEQDQIVEVVSRWACS